MGVELPTAMIIFLVLILAGITAFIIRAIYLAITFKKKNKVKLMPYYKKTKRK